LLLARHPPAPVMTERGRRLEGGRADDDGGVARVEAAVAVLRRGSRWPIRGRTRSSVLVDHSSIRHTIASTLVRLDGLSFGPG